MLIMTSIADIQMTTIAPRVESIAADIMLLFSEDDFKQITLLLRGHVLN